MMTRRSLALALAVLVAASGLPRAARADLQIGRFSIEFRNSNYNLKTGDIVLTGGVSGKGPDGDFRADRAFGNRERQTITLVGNVVAHRKAAAQPITLSSDTATIDERSRTYIASGHVSALVGPRTMSADEMRLDDRAHVFTLAGNVHITEPPGRSLVTDALIYHDDTGDIEAPGQVSGTTAEGDFRANSAKGNVKAGSVVLSGGVVLHSGGPVAGPSSEPATLYANTLTIDGPAKMVTATGDVKIEQGTQVVTAPLLRLNNATGDLLLSGGVHGEQPPDRSFDTKELTYNLNTGALTVPGAVKGTSSEGSFSGDTAHGNMKSRVYDLAGHAILHSTGKRAKGPKQTPTVLTAQHVHIDELAKRYLAEGGVTITQGDRTVSAPLLTFDDNAHIVKLTGGVHATQLPDRSADTAQVTYHTDTGAVLAPSTVSGRSTSDAFRADRAVGNAKDNVYDLDGNVMMRRQTATDKDPAVLTASNVRIDGNAKSYVATGHPKVTQGTRTMTGQVMSLNDTTHVLRVTGGVHAEAPGGRSFDTPELTYNTQSDDFKMAGGITAFFPLSKPSPTPTPFPTPKSKLSPDAPAPFGNTGIPAQYASPSPSPAPTPKPSSTPSPSPTTTPSPSPH
jgi:lipopolysaccharide assembly outer membrane protein LptD (OstA)